MGAAASVVTKGQCQALCGDLFDESEWDKQAVDGVVSRDKLTTVLSTLTDAFLTHDWGSDGGTHTKVSVVNHLLQARGITTWFDQEKMEGNVKKQMIHGIDNARVIVVFVTQRYIAKVGGPNAEDNCQLEFNYAARRKTASRMIPVLIDPTPALKNPASWNGEVGFVLGGHLYLDLSGTFDDDHLLASKVDELVAKIVSIGGTPLARRFPPESPSDAKEQAKYVPSPPVVATLQAAPVFSAPTVSLASLTKEDVALLLNALACSKFSAAFLENEVTGEVLCGAANVEEIKELGMPLAAKARVLFDKIAEFKASGVPPTLLRDKTRPSTGVISTPSTIAEVKTTELSGSNVASTAKSFEDITMALLPSEWVAVMKYKLEVNGANTLSKHTLSWFDSSCSVSAANGFFSDGNYAAELKGTASSRAMRLQAMGGRLDKNAFLLRFRMKPMAGGATPLAAGRFPWFAIDVTTDLCLALSCNQGKDVFFVKMDGAPVTVALAEWVDVAILVSIRTASIIQVVLDSKYMDAITVDKGFELHIPTDVNQSLRDTEHNQLYLFRPDTHQGLFHGYLRDIEMYSTLPASRKLPRITDADDPDRHRLHLTHRDALVEGLTLAFHYPKMAVDAVDIVTGRAMTLPGGSFIHSSLGAYFDGNYYDDTELDRNLVVAGKLGATFSRNKFAVAITMAPLAACCVFCMGSYYRWFGLTVTNTMEVKVTFNNQRVGLVVRQEREMVRLSRERWHDVVVVVDGLSVTVLIDGNRMDELYLPQDFTYTAPPDADNDMFLVNYSCSGCFHGFMREFAMWKLS
ncbi:hypothetical protein H257_01374 [Aphanomyces astaci]|uniref:TIR domain-containing protein n=1 Tax=Aphanomyces astaci TaxID=112090 RepID=W4HA38_APHAT|nr:hypothetical protein H257_01374 [Aphanomyces astaci]ETV87978.1 hypothetical protein H257_01374 [Aphanomyces astaci]|eukprot:XP_009822841.1 hypothetical protein H257_01374 [Aphanomyces astaci]